MAQGGHVRLSRKLRGWVRGLGLRAFGIGVVAKTPQGTFLVDPKDFGVGRALLDKGAYDSAALAYLLERVDEHSTVVFVGAHIGALVVPVARRVKTVVAFEPNPPTFEMLEANVKLNDLKNVTLHRVAASNCKQSLFMQHNDINTGGSSVSVSDDRSGVAVDAITLDELLDGMSIDLMVVDAEGFEVQVFQGGQGALANTRMLYTEFSPTMLGRQGSCAEDFFAALSPHFTFMSLETNSTETFAQDAWMSGALAAGRRKDFLVNLTFL